MGFVAGVWVNVGFVVRVVKVCGRLWVCEYVGFVRVVCVWVWEFVWGGGVCRGVLWDATTYTCTLVWTQPVSNAILVLQTTRGDNRIDVNRKKIIKAKIKANYYWLLGIICVSKLQIAVMDCKSAFRLVYGQISVSVTSWNEIGYLLCGPCWQAQTTSCFWYSEITRSYVDQFMSVLKNMWEDTAPGCNCISKFISIV